MTTVTALTATALLLLAAAAGAAPGGGLDARFGAGGKVTSEFGESTGVGALALQRDGRIVAGGSADARPVLARFRSDGSVDASFGDGGRAPTVGVRIALQRDGKIVAGGTADGDFVLARHLPDGSPDASFGVAGRVTADLGGFDFLQSVLARPDGTIVAAGWTFAGATPRGALAAFRADGTLDPGFGTRGGVVAVPGSIVQAAATAPGGKLVVLGARLTPEGHIGDVVVARFTARGALDRSFSRDGVATVGPERRGGPGPTAVAVQRDGKVVVAALNAQGNAFGVVRFRANGTLDRDFGAAASREQPYPVYTLRGLAIDALGRIVVAGSGPDLAVDFFVARLTPAGRLDERFGRGGFVTTDVHGRDDATAVLVQPDGKIVAGGWTGAATGGSQRAFMLVRYLASTCRVPALRGTTPAAARRSLARAGCVLGTVKRRSAALPSRGRVVRQQPARGTVVPDHVRVSVVVGR